MAWQGLEVVGGEVLGRRKKVETFAERKRPVRTGGGDWGEDGQLPPSVRNH